jgi:hypothetical protein
MGVRGVDGLWSCAVLSRLHFRDKYSSEDRVVKKLPGLKEKDITMQIRNVLKMYGIYHWKVWQGLGSAPGISDILGVLPGGRLLAIEVKTERGKLSPHQERFLKNITDNGGLAFVARSFDEVVQRLKLENRTST